MSSGTHLYRRAMVAVLVMEFFMHVGTLSMAGNAILTRKAGAFAALQFSMDAVVLLVILAMLFVVGKRMDSGKPYWIQNLIGFFAIFLFSLTGATGLAVQAADGNGFREEFDASVSGKCTRAKFVIGVSWAAVVIALLGVLASLSDKFPRVVATDELRESSPRIHISSPTTLYATSQSWDPHNTRDPTRHSPA